MEENQKNKENQANEPVNNAVKQTQQQTTNNTYTQSNEAAIKTLNGYALTSFICALAGVVLGICVNGWIGVAGSILGIIFGAIGIKKFDNEHEKDKWMAITGLIIGIVYMVIFLIIFMITIMYLASFADKSEILVQNYMK